MALDAGSWEQCTGSYSFSFLAAEVPDLDVQAWNLELLAMIEAEKNMIQAEGYSEVLTRDFNGHIGSSG